MADRWLFTLGNWAIILAPLGSQSQSHSRQHTVSHAHPPHKHITFLPINKLHLGTGPAWTIGVYACMRRHAGSRMVQESTVAPI